MELVASNAVTGWARTMSNACDLCILCAVPTHLNRVDKGRTKL